MKNNNELKEIILNSHALCWDSLNLADCSHKIITIKNGMSLITSIETNVCNYMKVEDYVNIYLSKLLISNIYCSAYQEESFATNRKYDINKIFNLNEDDFAFDVILLKLITLIKAVGTESLKNKDKIYQIDFIPDCDCIKMHELTDNNQFEDYKSYFNDIEMPEINKDMIEKVEILINNID